MKALCYFGEKDIRYADVPDATIEDDEDVVVKVERCGICGSDLHIYHGQVSQMSSGCPIGHEAVGEVVEVGSAVRKLRPGARVMLAPMIGCGHCDACAKGMLNRCTAGPAQGFGFGFGLGGCQAEAIRVPRGDQNAIRIPEGISFDQALMLTDNLPTAYAACLRADIPMGGTVVVVGLGCIGLLAVECAFLLGAAQVFAIDPVAERRDLARTLGAHPLHPDSAADMIRELTASNMADSVVEAVGNRKTVELAFALVGKMRTVSIAGSGQAVTEKGSSIPIDVAKDAFYFGTTIRIMPVTEVSRYWGDLIPHIRAGRLDPTRLITDRLPLSEGGGAYHRFAQRLDGVLKMALQP